MASRESGAVRALYRRWAEERANPDAATGEPGDDQWAALTAEPDGVDYVEADAGGVPAIWAVPRGSAADRAILCLHGGGFISGSLRSHRKLFGHLASVAGVRTLLVDYRLAPAHTFPAQLEDALTAYRWLLDRGIGAERIALAGDSSGGGLCVTSQLRARELGVPLAAALLLMSPWVDMEVSGESYGTNRESDPFFHREMVQGLVGMFLLAGGGNPTDPLANPLYADLTGLPPVYIQVGAEETCLDDSRRLAAHARAAGVAVRLDVFPEQQHTFQMAAGNAPEADDAINRLAQWVRPRLGR